MQIIGGPWLDKPLGQNIGGSSPTKSAPIHCIAGWSPLI